MKAVALDRFGPPSVLTLHELPVPSPGPREVLIAIDTAGVGTWDASIRDGSWRAPGRPRFPLVPGTDGAGTVVATGSRVTRLRVGDRVYAYEFGNRQGGFYAEFVVAGADHVGRVPGGLSLRDAGAAATIGLTALQGIRRLRLRPRDTVLIFGASGAVGTMAVQFAAQQRVRVLATASGKAAARLVRSLGADAIIDARRDAAIDRLRELSGDGIDAVLALAGGPRARTLPRLRTKGRTCRPSKWHRTRAAAPADVPDSDIRRRGQSHRIRESESPSESIRDSRTDRRDLSARPRRRRPSAAGSWPDRRPHRPAHRFAPALGKPENRAPTPSLGIAAPRLL